MGQYPTYLIHYGIPGQKWGERRFQNEDGTWTPEGLERRRKDQAFLYKNIKKDVKKGNFNPDDYRHNLFIRSEIEKKDLINVTKDRNDFRKRYNELSENEKKRDEIYNKYREKEDKEAYDAIKGKKFRNKDDEYNAWELARWKAEDKYSDQLLQELDKAGISWDTKYPIDIGGYKELVNKNATTAEIADSIAESIMGKYSNKNIKTMKTTEAYRKYINDIVENTVNKEIEFQEQRLKMKKEYEQKIPKLEKKLKEADLLTEDRYWNARKNNKMSEKEIFSKDKRLNDAAITGLKALDGPKADLSAGNKFWFVCEDQTIGYTTIADLANRGYSEKQIKDLVNTANDYYYNPIHEETAADLGMKVPKGTWHLTELYNGDKFIENCVKVVKENTLSDAKQSRIKSLIASGKSQEEVAKMLGVSTSTVNKYK